MAQQLPFTYYRCSCVDAAPSVATRGSQTFAPAEDEEEKTFDPKSPRANYSLFPLEHLLYCTECHQVRCARCISEEIVCWYCPSCLFEVPSSTVRTEGNRCNRSCYNCPTCTSPMTVTSIEPPTEDAASSELPTGPFILSCPYCSWTSLDIGIKFEKHNNITSQLQKIYNASQKNPLSPTDRSGDEGAVKSPLSPGSSVELPASRPPDTADLFNRLHSFYKTQIAESSDSGPGYGGLADLNYNSPSSISRLLNLYSGAGKKAGKRQKPQPMREALSLEEGLQILQKPSEDTIIRRLRDDGWPGTASTSQRHNQTHNHDVRFTSDLRPVATLLRTKRSKRCRACRTLLSRPEPKVSSTRYKIKVLALNNIPRVSIRSLQSLQSSTTAPASPTSNAFNYEKLQPLLPQQFFLTLTNPLFDPIRVTLATPTTTPGRVQSRVTILCPEFDVGANTDVWDDALNSSTTKSKSMLAEAGKVWERGRNWTSVIVEVVPGLLPGSTGTMGAGGKKESGAEDEEEGLEEDEDVLEIPVFVRIGYETEAQGAEEKIKDREGKEKREVAFWCVLDVGRIAP